MRRGTRRSHPPRGRPVAGIANVETSRVAYRRLIGPGIVAAGVGLSSGEFVLFPVRLQPGRAGPDPGSRRADGDEPLPLLLVIAAVVGGFMMFVYCG